MSKFVHGLAHAGLIVLNGVVTYGAVATHLVPAKYAPLITAAGGLAQAILALVNHGSGNGK
jgi:hypothetical protein